MDRSNGATELNQTPIRSIDLDEFVRRLHKEACANKRFAFFLGAGCSVTSGIPAAGSLVRDHWIPRLRDYRTPQRLDLDKWATEIIPEYCPENPAGSYGALIDRLFLTPEDRQQEIENLCEGRTPSFGYAVLAQLVAINGGPFNVVLTTNFDDLLSDALYLYTDARPLVIYHESLASFIRPTKTRPLLIKLHGDHHLSPRNTSLETSSLEEAIQRHTAMVLHDRGVIFMGYGGADAGILKMLNGLPPEALPFGAFWVHPQEPVGEIRGWLSRRKGVWVRSGWFDEVMLLIRNVFAFPHPSSERFTGIFQAYQQKFQELSVSIQDKPASADVQALKKAVVATEALFPDLWKAISEAGRLERHNPDRANEVYEQAIKQFPNEASLLGNYAVFLKNQKKDYDAAESMYKRALEADPKNPANFGNYANFLQDERQNDDPAEALYRRGLEVDPKNAVVLGNYATFLRFKRRDYGAAGIMYKRAIEADPKHTNNLANFAGFLLARGDSDGLAILQRALEAVRENPVPPAAEIESAFYSFVHGQPEYRTAAMYKLRHLLEAGVRSPGWDLSENVARSKEDGHPDASWIGKLAAVINEESDATILNDWPTWQNARSHRG